MKKILTALVCSVIILSSSLCMAAVDGSKILLGSIYPGMNENDFVSVFGQPTYKDGNNWTYPNFKVEIEHGIVTEVSTCSETIITPDSVRVGLAAEALNSTFGKADKIDYDSDGVEYKYYQKRAVKAPSFSYGDETAQIILVIF